MGFQYSCFISYRQGQEELTRTFINELTIALNNYTEPLLDDNKLKAYVDIKKNYGGVFLDINLFQALCNSVCMILIYTPNYFSCNHLYCTREFLAMQLIEEKRFEIAQIPVNQRLKSFIIPVIFRGTDTFPPSIKNNSKIYFDFSKYSLAKPNIRDNSEYVGEIEKIADHIRTLYNQYIFHNNIDLIDQIQFPSEEEALNFVKQNPSSISPFPGRKENYELHVS